MPRSWQNLRVVVLLLLLVLVVLVEEEDSAMLLQIYDLLLFALHAPSSRLHPRPFLAQQRRGQLC
jgi:hypothetical protein